MSDFASVDILDDSQVAILYDIKIHEVPEFRKMISEEMEPERDRVLGLLHPSGNTRVEHEWTREQDEILSAEKLTSSMAELSELWNLPEKKLNNRRYRLRGGHKTQERSRLRAQDETLHRAHNHGEEWSKADEHTLLTFAGSLTELAHLLGRSYSSVTARRVILRKERELVEA